MKTTVQLYSIFIALMILLVILSCTDTNISPKDGPRSVSWIAIKVGLTDSTYNPEKIGLTPQEFFERLNKGGLKIRWEGVNGAEYYEVRVSKKKITSSNWSKAALAATVPDNGESDIQIEIPVLKPKIIANKCTGCEYCVDACPTDAITMINNIAVIDLSKCWGCGKCYDTCAYNAVTDCFLGEDYFFGVRTFSKEDVPSAEVMCTYYSYKLRYTNWAKTKLGADKCLRCASGCYILDPTYGPGCPVDAIYWETDKTNNDTYGLIYIDQSKCIYCGECLLQCGVKSPGPWSIRKEVVSSEKPITK